MPSCLRPFSTSVASWTLLALVLPQLAACSSASPTGPRPPEWNPANETKCKVTRSQSRPLIVEWPSSDRVALESTMKDGLAAVRASGCEVEVLTHCKAPGRYGYRGTSKESDAVSISSEDDLYANLPLGAASLSGKLQSSGSLSVNMAVVGRYVVEGSAPGASELQGDGCERATHYISAVSVGAFTLSAGGSQEASGGVDVKVAGAGARTASKREELKSGGNVASCEKASRKDMEPPDGCGALLRIELVPLPEGRSARAVPTAPRGDDTATPATTAPRGTAAPRGTTAPRGTSRPAPTATAQPTPASPMLLAAGYMTSFGLLGLIVGGLGALNQKKTAEAQCRSETECTQEGADARKTGRTMAWIANGGAALTALGVGFYFLAPRPGKPSAAVGVNGNGVQIAGEF